MRPAGTLRMLSAGGRPGSALPPGHPGSKCDRGNRHQAECKALIAVTVGLFWSLPAHAQQTDASDGDSRAVTGTVLVEDTGQQLENVLVELESSGLQTLTDSAGRYTIRGASAGIDTVKATYFDLWVVRRPVDLSEPGTHSVDLSVPNAAIHVADLVVTVDAYAGMSQRIAKRAVFGRLVTRPVLERRAPGQVSGLFRTFPRTRVVYPLITPYLRAFDPIILIRGIGGWCPAAVFFNEHPATFDMLNMTHSNEVVAVEVYWDPMVPGEFSVPGKCGAINVWTEHP